MTARAARLGVQRTLGVLFAVLVGLSVLAHHELMGPMGPSGAPMSVSMPASQPSVGHGVEGMAPGAAKSGAVSVEAAESACGSEAVCSAAGVMTPPLPAALPQADSVVAPACSGACVRPLPPGTGPPPPADTSSVLRI